MNLSNLSTTRLTHHRQLRCFKCKDIYGRKYKPKSKAKPIMTRFASWAWLAHFKSEVLSSEFRVSESRVKHGGSMHDTRPRDKYNKKLTKEIIDSSKSQFWRLKSYISTTNIIIQKDAKKS